MARKLGGGRSANRSSPSSDLNSVRKIIRAYITPIANRPPHACRILDIAGTQIGFIETSTNELPHGTSIDLVNMDTEESAKFRTVQACARSKPLKYDFLMMFGLGSYLSKRNYTHHLKLARKVAVRDGKLLIAEPRFLWLLSWVDAGVKAILQCLMLSRPTAWHVHTARDIIGYAREVGCSSWAIRNEFAPKIGPLRIYTVIQVTL